MTQSVFSQTHTDVHTRVQCRHDKTDISHLLLLSCPHFFSSAAPIQRRSGWGAARSYLVQPAGFGIADLGGSLSGPLLSPR